MASDFLLMSVSRWCHGDISQVHASLDVLTGSWHLHAKAKAEQQLASKLAAGAINRTRCAWFQPSSQTNLLCTTHVEPSADDDDRMIVPRGANHGMGTFETTATKARSSSNSTSFSIRLHFILQLL
jgi:hypothetical protein